MRDIVHHRWRYKVYQLLVQQKSHYLVSRTESKNWEELTGSLQGQLRFQQSKIQELESTIRERQLQIDVLAKQREVCQC